MTAEGARQQASASCAEHWREKLTPSEQYLADIFGGFAVAQLAVGNYVLDFAFQDARVAVEVDGKGHWSAARKAHDIARDAWLVSQGWRVVRVSRAVVRKPRHLVTVLQQMIPGLHVDGALPDDPTIKGRQYRYRVLVRDAECPTGRKV